MVNGGWFRAALGSAQRLGLALTSAMSATSRYAGGIAFGPAVSLNVRPMAAVLNEKEKVEFSGCHFPWEHPANRATAASVTIMRISRSPWLASVEIQRSSIRKPDVHLVTTFPGSRSSLAI